MPVRLAVEQHVLDARLHQLEAHVHREGDRDEAQNRRGDQIEDADVLVVGGHEPSGEEPGLVVAVVRMNSGVGHA